MDLSMPSAKPITTLRLPAELRSRLDERATDEDVSLNTLCERLLRLGLDYITTIKESPS